MKKTEQPTRRGFVQGCAALTSASLMSTLLNLRLTQSALAASGPQPGYKAMVCFFFHGGIDMHNVLAPYEDDEYNDYATIRENLAIDKADMLPISHTNGRQFGLHPALPEVQNLYNAGNLAFVANIGSLIEKTDKAAYQARRNLPLGLFSHSDQQQHWQTSIPQSRSQITGWAGRMADLLTDATNNNDTISMNIALKHVNILQTGDVVFPYVIQTNGATLLSGYNSNNAQDRIATRINDSLLEQTYSNLLEQTHATMRRNSIDAAINFNQATSNVALTTVFPNTDIGRQMQMVARTIGARTDLDQTRQIYFIERGGWDHHAGLIANQANMLPEINDALRAFYDATVELGVENDVVTYGVSDFARTLSSNGKGSDHAWGSNHFIMGGAVKGGQIYGNYPASLAAGNPIDVGRGRLIPDTSVDEYNAELAMWFGLGNDSNLEAVLPNIRNFYASGAGSPPLGFLL